MDAKCDWSEVELEYRSTAVSVKELGRRHGVSDTAIRKKAKANGWVRAVEPTANRTQTMPIRRNPAANAPEPAADVKLIVQRGKNLVLRMLDELDTVTSYIGELEDMIELETANDKDGKRRQAMLRAISLGSRSTVAKNLASALKTMQEGAPAQGKREQAQEAAEKAANKFAVPSAPKLVVDNR